MDMHDGDSGALPRLALARGLRPAGLAIKVPDGRVFFFIHNPPIGFIRESRWAGCFHQLSNVGPVHALFRTVIGKPVDGWYYITFAHAETPQGPDEGIAGVNRVLNSAIRPLRG